MKEITRIHIAKYPYDIEVAAKKELENYIKKLEMFSDDENLLEDIEIRMTEILAERNVEKNGLISSDDIAAIKTQLGEPKEFWGEGDMAIGPEEISAIADRPRRRVYRDIDGAVLGGVLSGLAKYIDINPIWTRIIFLILLAISFGTASIIYAILWIILPSARTAAEKLEASGKPITLASIKDLNERAGERVNTIAPTVQAIIRYVIAAGLILTAIGTLIFTIMVGFGFTTHLWWFGPDDIQYFLPNTWLVWLALGLMVAAGLLLVSLFTLLGVALIRKKWAKRFTVTTIIVIAAGLLSFGGGVAIMGYGAWQQNAKIESSKTTAKSALPLDFKNVKSLVANTTAELSGHKTQIAVRYIVTNEAPRYEVTSLDNSVKPVVSVNGTTATLKIDTKKDARGYIQPVLTIYGPALESVVVSAGSFEYTNKGLQDTLSINTYSEDTNNPDTIPGSFVLFGTYNNVTAITDSGSIMMDQATIQNLGINLKKGYINAGVVKNLSVTQPDVCPAPNAGSSDDRIVVRGTADNTLTYNGKVQPAATVEGKCGTLIIGNEQDYDQSKYEIN